MSRSLIGTLLLALLTVLFLLRKREQKKKAAEQAAQLESRGYLPVSIEDAEPDFVTKSADTVIRVYRGISLAAMTFLIAMIAFLAVMEPLVRWILTGTLVVMGGIVAIWSISRRSS